MTTHPTHIFLGDGQNSGAVDPAHFFFGVTSLNHDPYLMVVEDASKFYDFAAKIAGTSTKMDQFISDYTKAFKNLITEKTEKLFLQIFEKFGGLQGAGIGLYRVRNGATNSWDRLSLSPSLNENPIPTGCN